MAQREKATTESKSMLNRETQMHSDTSDQRTHPSTSHPGASSRPSDDTFHQDSSTCFRNTSDERSSRSDDVKSKVQVELAINFNDESDLKAIDETLAKKNIKLTSNNANEKTFHIELDIGERDKDKTETDICSIQRSIEQQTGLTTVIKGVGRVSSAVSELRPPPKALTGPNRRHAYGVVRLSQLDGNLCYVDGLVDGLQGDNMYSLSVHEYGDLSGESFETVGDPHIHLGLYNSSTSEDGRLFVQKLITDCHVPSMIGRSIALSSIADKGITTHTNNHIVSAGVIARASTISANQKQVCSCSGKTLWREREDKRAEEKKI